MHVLFCVTEMERLFLNLVGGGRLRWFPCPNQNYFSLMMWPLYVDHIPEQGSFSRLPGQHKLDLMEKEENKKK